MQKAIDTVKEIILSVGFNYLENNTSLTQLESYFLSRKSELHVDQFSIYKLLTTYKLNEKEDFEELVSYFSHPEEVYSREFFEVKGQLYPHESCKGGHRRERRGIPLQQLRRFLRHEGRGFLS